MTQTTKEEYSHDRHNILWEFKASILIDLKADDLIVSGETAIKADLDIKVNPELISVLKIEPQRPTGDPKVNVDTNPVF